MATKKKAKKSGKVTPISAAKQQDNQQKPTQTGDKLQVRNSLLQEATKATATLRQFGDFVKRRWANIGKICGEAKEKNLFKYLRPPYKDLVEWAESCEVGRSTMYNCIRVYGALKMIAMPELLKMTVMNAGHLARLPLDTRKDPLWIKRAQTMKEGEFEQLVNKEVPKKARDASALEKRVPLIFSVYESQKDMILETIDEHGAHTNKTKKSERGDLLEEICAEFRAGFSSDALVALKKLSRAFAGHLQLELSKLKALQAIDQNLSVEEQLKLHQQVNDEVLAAALQVTKGFGEQLMLEGMEEQLEKQFGRKKKEKSSDKGDNSKKNGHAPVGKAAGKDGGGKQAPPAEAAKDKAAGASA